MLLVREDVRSSVLCVILSFSFGYLIGLGEIDRAAKADRGAAVQAGPHQEELGGEVAALRAAVGVPVRALGLVVRAAFEDAEARPAVAPLALGPFPRVAAHVVAAEWRTALAGMPSQRSSRRCVRRCSGRLPRHFPMGTRVRHGPGPRTATPLPWAIACPPSERRPGHRPGPRRRPDGPPGPAALGRLASASGSSRCWRACSRSAEELRILRVGHGRQVDGVRRQPDLALEADDLVQVATGLGRGLLAGDFDRSRTRDCDTASACEETRPEWRPCRRESRRPCIVGSARRAGASPAHSRVAVLQSADR